MGSTRYVGLYTVASRPADTAPGSICTVTCFEALPATPDRVIGIDGDGPGVTIVSPQDLDTVAHADVPVFFSPFDDIAGLERVECLVSKHTGTEYTVGGFEFSFPTGPHSFDDGFTPCGNGSLLHLGETDGHYRIEVRAIDQAGNATTARVVVRLDRSVPTATAALSALPATGWYRVAPTVTLNEFEDDDDPRRPGNPPYAYRFDGGLEKTLSGSACLEPPPVSQATLDKLGTIYFGVLLNLGAFALPECTIPAAEFSNLLPGHHTLSFTAIDAAGNRRIDGDPVVDDMQKVDIPFDNQGPTVAVATTPARGGALVGVTEVHTVAPLVSVVAVDQPGASDVDPARVTYVLDGATSHYDGPFEVAGPGLHTVCATAFDKAGNPGGTACTTFTVDATPPVVTSVVSPGPPTGGWYRSPPTIVLNATDVGIAGAPAPQLRYRVDVDGELGAVQACGSGCTVDTDLLVSGRVGVSVHAVDAANNESADHLVRLDVDLPTEDTPVSSTYLSPAAGTGPGGGFTIRPWVELAAEDLVSGVSQHSLRNGWAAHRSHQHVHGPVPAADRYVRLVRLGARRCRQW